jgi:beta-lactamase superfamily II metal-dependent hydrolase
MGVDQLISALEDGEVFISNGTVYTSDGIIAEPESYNSDPNLVGVKIKNLNSFSVVSPGDATRHTPAPQEDFVTADPNQYNAQSTHTWKIGDPDYGTPGESGDEVDTIEISYQSTEFGGINETVPTVTMARTLSSGISIDEIGLNSGSYSGTSATLDLSGFSQSDAAGFITVEIPQMINAPEPETCTLTLTGDAGEKTFQGLVPEPNPRATPPSGFDLYHVDVGQADSSVLRTPENETIVIDTGNDGIFTRLLLDELEVDKIDALIATHAHTDHIGGHERLINEFENNRKGITRVYDNGVSTGSQTYIDYIDTVDSFGIPLILPREGDTLPIDGATLDVLNPGPGDLNSIQHDNCVTIKAISDDTGTSWLQTGDANFTAEGRMVSSSEANVDSDIYNVGHHGASNSTSQEFLDAVAPTHGIISSPLDSPFDHPKADTLNKLDAKNIPVYWTAKHGRVVTRASDPPTFDPESTFSTDPADFAAEKQ